jgi:hypothetical protein
MNIRELISLFAIPYYFIHFITSYVFYFPIHLFVTTLFTLYTSLALFTYPSRFPETSENKRWTDVFAHQQNIWNLRNHRNSSLPTFCLHIPHSLLGSE